MPISFAIAMAVILWPPVIITGRIPARIAFFTASTDSGLGGSIIAIIPTVNFSGLNVPTSTLAPAGWLIGQGFPGGWFQPVSVGSFVKGFGGADLAGPGLVLAGFAVLYLALAATLLMALAPVVSRWVQAGHVQHTRAMALPEARAGHAAMTDAAHAHHLAGHAPAATPAKAPPDPHAVHGEACDYCTMASRLLPWLAVLLVLLYLL